MPYFPASSSTFPVPCLHSSWPLYEHAKILPKFHREVERISIIFSSVILCVFFCSLFHIRILRFSFFFSAYPVSAFPHHSLHLWGPKNLWILGILVKLHSQRSLKIFSLQGKPALLQNIFQATLLSHLSWCCSVFLSDCLILIFYSLWILITYYLFWSFICTLTSSSLPTELLLYRCQVPFPNA